MKIVVFASLCLAVAAPAGAIEAYRAQEIQPYQAQEIQRYQAQDIEKHQAPQVQQYQSDRVDQARGQMGGVPSGARNSAIEPYVAPVPAQPRTAPQPERQKKPAAPRGARALLGVWQTNVPGAVYTTPSGMAGYDVLHVSSGAAAGLLRLNPNGTYSWNSYGGKKGKWLETGDAEYPIEIVDTVENRRWRVGYSASKGTLIVWSGSIWYEGRRAAVKK